MPSLARLLSLLALCAALSPIACKDGTSSPPAAEGPAEPADQVVEAPAGDPVPVVNDAPAADPGADGAVICTPETRKGGVCTREYMPVCGSLAGGATRTFANKCMACSDEQVASYVVGPCPGDPAS